MKIYLKKSLSSLVPADDEAAEALKKYKQGDTVSCEIRKPRNVDHHRKYFALLNLVVDNQERFRNTQELLDAIKFELGYVETRRKIVKETGSWKYSEFYQVPKSISFTSMDQHTFDRFYSKSIDIILQHILPGINRDELEAEVLSFG